MVGVLTFIPVQAPIYPYPGELEFTNMPLASPQGLQEAPSEEFTAEVDEVTAAKESLVREANKAGVSSELVLYIVENESKWDSHAIGDMDKTCKSTGKPVRARGWFQLTECYYPNIPDSCAFDLECSAKVALPLIKDKETCISQFSTCRKYYAK